MSTAIAHSFVGGCFGCPATCDDPISRVIVKLYGEVEKDGNVNDDSIVDEVEEEGWARLVTTLSSKRFGHPGHLLSAPPFQTPSTTLPVRTKNTTTGATSTTSH